MSIKKAAFTFSHDGHEYIAEMANNTVYDSKYYPVATWDTDPSKEHWIVESIDGEKFEQFPINSTNLFDALRTVI